MAQGDASGLYWALPTQATANALYGRLSMSYRKLFEDAPTQPSLALAHGSVDLHKEFNQSLTRPADPLFRPSMDETAGAPENPYGTGEEQETASALCAQWLASDRRRSLLADVGVGTVDQALLAALPIKFQSLRLAALSEHVLIVDEAHSYDKYTTRLLKQVLGFQAALGGSAIILSATLTSAAKNELLTAFAEGAGWVKRNRCETVKSGTPEFPLASLLSAPAAKASYRLAEKVLPALRGTRRDLAVTQLENAEAAVASLVSHARAGRCAVWIRNTVQDAIDGADALRGAAPEITPWLFHSRFALADRAAIERHVIENFGKDGENRHSAHRRAWAAFSSRRK